LSKPVGAFVGLEVEVAVVVVAVAASADTGPPVTVNRSRRRSSAPVSCAGSCMSPTLASATAPMTAVPATAGDGRHPPGAVVRGVLFHENLMA
jgi:hypothetical protein